MVVVESLEYLPNDRSRINSTILRKRLCVNTSIANDELKMKQQQEVF